MAYENHERELDIAEAFCDENTVYMLQFRSSDADKCGYVQKRCELRQVLKILA